MAKTDSRLTRPSPIEEVALRIHDEVLCGYQAGQKIVPERKLALLLDTSQSRIHRAIELLSRQGLVQTRRGDGTYVADPVNRARAEDASLTPPQQMRHHFRQVSRPPLQVRIPIGENLREQSMWQRAIAAYKRENPSIEVEIDFSPDGSRSVHGDVTVVSAHHLHEHRGDFSALNLSSLEQNGFRAGELLQHATTPCSYEGDLLGVPVLRTTSILMANRRILDRFGIDSARFTNPVDLFRIGAEIETRSGGRIRGCNYYGMHWHFSLAGLHIGSSPGGVSQSQELAKFLKEHQPFLREHHFKQTQLGEKLFLLGEFALRTDYSYQLPAAKLQDELELIVLPRDPGGWAVEGMCVACMPRDCPGREEAYGLLAFLASGTAQQQLVAEDPHWLSVHAAVLEAQKTSSPFPAGALQHDLDKRSYSVFRDRRYFQTIGPRLEAESEKYFLGEQDLETTLKNMKRGDT